ncbi:hypothetical protein DFA_02914 [Cavenderia fasciculata]|uniref:Uncharacterized protein n=1 Tax=Cavenderia fasciculata TaxID=261658 RepID=F4PIU1_CACFS|nr:uncharacterized protein DFA_02914 [Cavenderia fasciculata]EGG24670.1 hypothetical protein DFA_02914 [Cavenderia fasciculata]|eukprot:XP_004362521.1 hypothetical protein DFA_02914 [Cavenderia fasciculata]
MSNQPPTSTTNVDEQQQQQNSNNNNINGTQLERITQYLQDGGGGHQHLLSQQNHLKPKLVRASSLQNLPSSRETNGIASNSIGINTGALPVNAVASNNANLLDKMDLIKFGEIADHPAPSSKYDFVKVKVRLEDHYYVLSRFLISRVLNVTKVDAADSVKISLELKKRLVDQGRLQISQADLESELFTLLQAYGYGNEYIERYRMTTQFHHQRVPLIILISGPKCIGKSYLATQLAERLNLSTVLQTTLVQDLMHAIITELASTNTAGGITSTSNSGNKDNNTSSKGPTMFASKSSPTQSSQQSPSVQSSTPPSSITATATATTTIPSSPSSFKEGAVPSSPSTQSALEKLKKPKIKGIIIPFVLSVNERDHMFLVENWLSCNPIALRYAREAFGDDPAQQCRGIVKNLQTIQEYLCQGVPPFQSVEVNPHSLLETLDSLHSAVLKRINKAYSGHLRGFEYE